MRVKSASKDRQLRDPYCLGLIEDRERRLLNDSADQRTAMPGAAGDHSSREAITSTRLSFVGLMVSVAGFFNILDGLTALLKTDYYLVTSSRLLVFNYPAWGVIWLILGVAQFVVGGAILAGQTWAKMPGIALTVLVVIGQFAFLNARPVWSIIVIAFCVVIIHELMAPRPGSAAR
ncbi:hypothetical protein AB0L00_00010 [Actinoallomurus sp. NPDC052308]|uniref:DUF7144 family membrane protein n=1 Tax=Actinoallomurus sp. NPDC052308 TaxID=3155530 RepID=UPI0034434A33